MSVGRRRASLTGAWIAGAAALSVAALAGVSRAAARAGGDAPGFLAWARSAAIPLHGLGPATTHGDLARLATTVGPARVVALGEPGHGAQQPLAFRNRLFRYLVKHDGVTAIALETSFTESRAIDDFVMGGGGDAAVLTRRNLSWGFGRYEANVRLIRWMRDYNEHAGGQRKLHFYGIDMSGGGDEGDYSHPSIAVRSAVAYLRTAAPRSSADLMKRIAPQLRLMDRLGYWQMALHDQASLETMLESLGEYFEANGTALRHAGSRADYDWAAHSLVVAGQLFDYLRLEPAPQGKSMSIGPLDYREDEVRETAMATNVLWALHEEGPEGKLLVYAHDAHVMNDRSRGGIWSVYKEAPVMMGGHLRADLGRRLVIIGALAAHNGPGLPADHPIPGSFEATLAALELPFFALDLRKARGNLAAAAWLDGRRVIRANFDTELDVIPAQAFDVIVFMDEVTRAKPNGAADR
ncbi:MAG TPA: erythromycin esterase family protein [Steroidobacteraceae bacterium]|nr:erythromycin esterase family protein [Steroidobacteraceae bacterium]